MAGAGDLIETGTTQDIKEWRSIITLIVFVITSKLAATPRTFWRS